MNKLNNTELYILNGWYICLNYISIQLWPKNHLWNKESNFSKATQKWKNNPVDTKESETTGESTSPSFKDWQSPGPVSPHPHYTSATKRGKGGQVLCTRALPKIINKRACQRQNHFMGNLLQLQMFGWEKEQGDGSCQLVRAWEWVGGSRWQTGKHLEYSERWLAVDTAV